MDMNPRALLKVLLPGLLPLLAFVIAEGLFGEVVGLIVGLAVGGSEFVHSLATTRKADPFVVADTLLLAIAGGLSLLLKNEVFFKLKPAVIEATLGAALAVLLLLPPSYLKGWMASQLRGISLPDSAMPAMKKGLTLMLIVLVLHGGLTVWAAVALSNAAWGFISGGLLYILFGLVAAVQFFAARRSTRSARTTRRGGEHLPVVDETGRVQEVVPAQECHQGPGRLHPAVHLLIVDSAGRLFLRRRVASLGREPGRWESALDVHVRPDETIETALARELGGQLGIVLPPPDSQEGFPLPLLRYRWEDEVESELVFAFLLRHTGPFALRRNGVEEGRFWTPEEIRLNRGRDVFTSRLEMEINLTVKIAGSSVPSSSLVQ